MTEAQIWSWIVVIIGITGFYFAGKKLWWAWYINIGGQVLWFIYGLISHQPAFLVSAVIYAIVQSRNAYLWTRDSRLKPFEYIKKPTKIQAVRLLDIDEIDGISVGSRGKGAGSVPSWLSNALYSGDICVGKKDNQPVLYVMTLEGEHVIRIGMWLIRGIKGELYGCDPVIFDELHQ